MKTSFLTFAAVAAGLVAAQNRRDYFPACSLDCLDQGTKAVTNCASDDAWCWCIQSNYEAIYNSATTCVIQKCGAVSALNNVLPAAIPFCSEATKQHAAATKVPEKETSAPAQATPTAPAEQKPTTAAVEPTKETKSTPAAQQSSAAAGQSSKPTSAPAAASSAPAAASSSAAAVPATSHYSTIIAVPTKSSNGTVSKPTASVVVVPTGAAVQIGSMGAAAMLALGALAAF